MKKISGAIVIVSTLILSACSNHALQNQNFEQALIGNFCDQALIEQSQEKINKNEDIIYTGLNAGLIARNCKDFQKSNFFFDKAEESYRFDIDEEGMTQKGLKLTSETLINSAINDYEGSLYERIMVNLYKGLNFMSLKDYENARVEFKRAQIRQDKAKEYFAKQINEERKKLDEAKINEIYQDNFNENFENISKEYGAFFKEFHSTKVFTNPYATYLASVFYFMDTDYIQASNLLRELALANTSNKELQRQYKIFENFASKTKLNDTKKYIFIIYEDGFAPIKEEFSFTLPLIINNNLITTSIALPVLKKREVSYKFIRANESQTSLIADFDAIIASEFQISMPIIISKALASTILKTSLNIALAKQSDNALGTLLSFGTSILASASTRADLRSWRGLPKSVSVLMLENTGLISIKDPSGIELYKNKLDANKNALLLVRSFSPNLAKTFFLIEK